MSPRRLTLPDSASVAVPDADGRLIAPSAERNTGAILSVVAAHAPASGRALELASGTGQHVAALAARFPAIDWTPSDVDPARLASIAAYRAAAGLENLRPALTLDATAPGWSDGNGPWDLVLLVNLLHLIGGDEARVLIAEAARTLAPGGRLMIYGPFMRAGELTSAGDAAFHASLAAQDPEIGYKDDFDTLDRMQEAGLEIAEVVEMPANNLTLVAKRPI